MLDLHAIIICYGCEIYPAVPINEGFVVKLELFKLALSKGDSEPLCALGEYRQQTTS